MKPNKSELVTFFYIYKIVARFRVCKWTRIQKKSEISPKRNSNQTTKTHARVSALSNKNVKCKVKWLPSRKTSEQENTATEATNPQKDGPPGAAAAS